MYIGESERKLHEIFEQARRTAPSVIFFDEIEAIGGKRQHAREATSAKVVSQFLTELDGFSQNNISHVLQVLGATNVPWAVDPAFRRPGRFDRVLFVPPPDADARKIILELLLADRPVADRLDLHEIVRRASGHSGADLRDLVDPPPMKPSKNRSRPARKAGSAWGICARRWNRSGRPRSNG